MGRRWLQKGLRREIDLVIRLIKKRFGVLDKPTERKIKKLPIEKVEELGLSLFDFKDINEMELWLKQASANN